MYSHIAIHPKLLKHWWLKLAIDVSNTIRPSKVKYVFQVLLHGHFYEIIIHTDENIDMQTQTQE